MDAVSLKQLEQKLETGHLLDVEFANHRNWVSSIGEPMDGLTISLLEYSTCYRRGTWRLYLSVNAGPGYHLWGCFDEQDQPMR